MSHLLGIDIGTSGTKTLICNDRGQVIAASLHIAVKAQTILAGQRVLRAVSSQLQERHRINHSTVQVELAGQCSDGLYCCIEPHEVHLGHSH